MKIVQMDWSVGMTMEAAGSPAAQEHHEEAGNIASSLLRPILSRLTVTPPINLIILALRSWKRTLSRNAREIGEFSKSRSIYVKILTAFHACILLAGTCKKQHS